MKNSGKVVLVTEDNAANMKLFHDLLKARGFNVLQAKDGMQGWELAREHRPDLILMDIQLPDISGIEVTRWLKNDEDLKSIPVIAITAFAMESDETFSKRLRRLYLQTDIHSALSPDRRTLCSRAGT